MGQAQITVCIPTYRRPEYLAGLLAKLESQQRAGRFDFTCVVVDNDPQGCARAVIAEAVALRGRQITYCHEPEQNMAKVRNRAVQAARGDYLALIDDDETPCDDWLLRLLTTCVECNVTGVLGPVLPRFVRTPPAWLSRSGLLDRPRYPTGHVLHWNQTRSGNVLLRRSLFEQGGFLFDPAFARSHEDKDFFRRAMAAGHKFAWCDEATVDEIVPPDRMVRRYFLRRAILRGNVAYRLADSRSRAVARSFVALCVYAAMLPCLQLSGHHRFMKYLVKSCDHAGLLLASIRCRLGPRPGHAAKDRQELPQNP